MFYFGVDYYPEQWDEARWAEDARLMSEAHFNVVRLAEFAWSKLEPREGVLDFDWLDRAISILAAHGLQIVLGTPTASPPGWLMMPHPELFRVREDGRRVAFGNRREYCPNQPVYRNRSCHIVSALAEHYADHRAVIGWQIDNEFGDRCYCHTCARAFHAWLRRRYVSLDELNARWGTIFWGHTYSEWEQIPLPLSTGGSPNPGLALDYARFASDSYVEYQQMQLDLLRARCPQHLLTHNLMGFKYDHINYFNLARNLDFVSWNNYPRSQWAMQAEVDPSRAALAHDTMRGLKRKNFWVMEQQAGSGGWEIVSVPPRPGELRLWAYQSIAHGADGILFFRWRTSRFGTEQYWHGLLDHDAKPSRRYAEIKRMGAEIKRAGEWIDGSGCRPAVAFLLSFDSRFAFQIQPNNPQFNYSEQFARFYRALYRRNIAIDVVEPTVDLSRYKLVIAPSLHVVSQEIAENLKRFVKAGGLLVVTPRSGVKDEANAVVDQRLPGLLAELCGIEVEEYDSLAPEASTAVEYTLPELAIHPAPSARVWCDVLNPTTAITIARYVQDYYAGKSAITLNRFGEGSVVYVGFVGDETLDESLSAWLLDLAGLEPVLETPTGVEASERWLEGRRLLFVLNHTELEQQITLERCYTNLLDGSTLPVGRVTLAPREVFVLLERVGH
jgi:beta-galactosidase